MSTAIFGVEYTLGQDTLSYEDLERRFGAEPARKVLAGSGIRSRRVAPPGVCGSDLAFESATRLFEKSTFRRDQIDLVIFCTQSADYLLPSSACILQDRLGLRKQCGAFDLNLGCTQYIYALGVAHGMVSAGLANTVLVLTGDTMTQTLHPMDRSVVPLLGDGGSASIVARTNNGAGFLGFEFGTDGSGHRDLIIPAGGFRIPRSTETACECKDAEGNIRSQDHMHMNGLAIFHFAIWVVPETVNRLLSRLCLTMQDIDLFLFHQANKYMLEYLFKKLRLPREKTHVFLEDIGNTSGSTMPIVLADALNAGKIKPGSLIFMMVFGVGLSWAATVVRWPESGVPTQEI